MATFSESMNQTAWEWEKVKRLYNEVESFWLTWS